MTISVRSIAAIALSGEIVSPSALRMGAPSSETVLTLNRGDAGRPCRSFHRAPAAWNISAGMIAVDDSPSSSSTTVTSNMVRLRVAASPPRRRPGPCYYARAIARDKLVVRALIPQWWGR